MKGISEQFTDEEHAFMKDRKGKTSWHDFILESVGYKKKGFVDKVLGR
jgi:hypothetical protein